MEIERKFRLTHLPRSARKDTGVLIEIPAEFSGIEVTDDERYKNKHLAIFGIPS